MNDWQWTDFETRPRLECVTVAGHELRAGNRVRLWPRAQADIMDMALRGKTATIEAIEQDYEGKVHLAVVIDDDPGRDLGLLRQVGHRFFYSASEIEPLGENGLAATPAEEESPAAPRAGNSPVADEPLHASTPPVRILVAGIGNIFLGDDAFGVEVAQKLTRRVWPEGVVVKDFGIRALDLAYAIESGPETVLLIDAAPRGGPPGTVYVIEPDLKSLAEHPAPVSLDAHTMNPVAVLRMAQNMTKRMPRCLLVGCEPADLGDPALGKMGLSPAVEEAVDRAVDVVASLVDRILQGAPIGAEFHG